MPVRDVGGGTTELGQVPGAARAAVALERRHGQHADQHGGDPAPALGAGRASDRSGGGPRRARRRPGQRQQQRPGRPASAVVHHPARPPSVAPGEAGVVAELAHHGEIPAAGVPGQQAGQRQQRQRQVGARTGRQPQGHGAAVRQALVRSQAGAYSAVRTPSRPSTVWNRWSCGPARRPGAAGRRCPGRRRAAARRTTTSPSAPGSARRAKWHTACHAGRGCSPPATRRGPRRRSAPCRRGRRWPAAWRPGWPTRGRCRAARCRRR